MGQGGLPGREVWPERGQVRGDQLRAGCRFLSTIGLTPDYKLRTQTVPNGYAWVKKPPFGLAGVEIPITAIVEKILDQQQAMVAAW